MANLDSQISRLTSNVDQVLQQKAVGIDAKGELIGEALRTSFKGKVARMLVDKGWAREGSLGGRVVAALVSPEDLKLLRTSSQELKTSTVTNVLNLVQELESEGVRDKHVLGDISSKVWSGGGAGLELRLLPGKIGTIHDTVRNQVIPAREAYRQGVVDNINSGTPIASMSDASQTALEVAREALKLGAPADGDWRGQLEKLPLKNMIGMTSGGQGKKPEVQALKVLNDLEKGKIQVEKTGDDAQVEAFEQEFVKVLDEQLAAVTREDGKHVYPRAQGPRDVEWSQGSEPPNQAVAGKPILKGAEAAQGSGAPGGLKFMGDILGPTFHGETLAELPGEADWARGVAEELNEAVQNNDKGTVLNLLKELNDVIRADGASDEARMAHELKQHPAFRQDFEGVWQLLTGHQAGLKTDKRDAVEISAGEQRGLQKEQVDIEGEDGTTGSKEVTSGWSVESAEDFARGKHGETVAGSNRSMGRWKFDQETTNLYRENAGAMREIVQGKIDEMTDVINNPEAHADYYGEYQDVYGAHGGDIARFEAQQTLREAKNLLSRHPVFE